MGQPPVPERTFGTWPGVKEMMLAALALAIPLVSVQKFEAVFEVQALRTGASPVVKGTSTFSSALGQHDDRWMIWTFKSAENDSGWRREWTYAPNGELKFQAYDVMFGTLVHRWTLAKQDGGWNLHGASADAKMDRKVRLFDPSVLWFCLKKVKVGDQTGIAVLDPSTFTARKGTARYARDETHTLRDGKIVPVHVIEKKFEDGWEVWYVNGQGTPMRIDLVMPKSGESLVFRTN